MKTCVMALGFVCGFSVRR